MRRRVDIVHYAFNNFSSMPILNLQNMKKINNALVLIVVYIAKNLKISSLSLIFLQYDWLVHLFLPYFKNKAVRYLSQYDWLVLWGFAKNWNFLV